MSMLKSAFGYIALLFCFFTFYLYAGFLSETVVHSVQGFGPIRLIELNDTVLASDMQNHSFEAPVTRVVKEICSRFTILVIEGEPLYVTDDQKLYLAQEKRWCSADNLRIGQYLLTRDGGSVRIDAVQIVESNEPLIFYDITVQRYHTFYITKHDILVHNFAMVIPILTWGSGAAATWFEGVTLANMLYALATGACLYGLEKATGTNIDAQVGADGTLNGRPLPGTNEHDRVNNQTPGGHIKVDDRLNPGGPCPCGHPCEVYCNCGCSCGCRKNKVLGSLIEETQFISQSKILPRLCEPNLKKSYFEKIYQVLMEIRGIHTNDTEQLRIFIEAIYYMCRAGCPWRLLPYYYDD
jgi:hypothetical protein